MSTAPGSDDAPCDASTHATPGERDLGEAPTLLRRSSWSASDLASTDALYTAPQSSEDRPLTFTDDIVQRAFKREMAKMEELVDQAPPLRPTVNRRTGKASFTERMHGSIEQGVWRRDMHVGHLLIPSDGISQCDTCDCEIPKGKAMYYQILPTTDWACKECYHRRKG